MSMQITTDIHTTDIHQTVKEGLLKTPKQLPSWLFYDEAGDKLFQAIMRMPEYYLTACEFEILQLHKETLRQKFQGDGSRVDIIEFGAGDGLKTEILLKYFSSQQTSFRYLPVDVSQSVLNQLTHRFDCSVPGMDIQPIRSRYDKAISDLQVYDTNRKVFLFLGANIGNFTLPEASAFMKHVATAMDEHDQFVVGFDLKKDPRMIQRAYDDPHGITRNFNMNLLLRLNRELGANFSLDQFSHYPHYDLETGTAKSYLVSLKQQDVFIEALQESIHFNRWETIHTEISQKYDTTMIERFAQQAGLLIDQYLYDCKHYFCDVLFKKKR